MKRIWPFRWVLAVVVTLTLTAWWYFPQKSSTASSQGQMTVKRGDILQRVLISGAIAAKRTTGIAPPYEGYIKQLYVDVGDDVKIGQPLVTISQLAHSKNEELYPILAPFSGKVVQIQKTEGEYLEKFASGQGKSAILRIDDLSEMFVQADVPEIDLGKLKIGQAAVIRATAVTGRTYKGEIISISRAPKGGDGWDRNRIEYPV
ncbi:MAG: efflux RND transporter periplasmic adaptor subunit, partial [Proteobacteria bacterium]|nr:efflux RND transporter periplasmic adaptor subunit [Pseudomonadota bacterium]